MVCWGRVKGRRAKEHRRMPARLAVLRGKNRLSYDDYGFYTIYDGGIFECLGF